MGLFGLFLNTVIFNMADKNPTNNNNKTTKAHKNNKTKKKSQNHKQKPSKEQESILHGFF